jgi:Mrp family chromosome partitioning ATPase
MKDFITQAREEYDFVIFDTPPVAVVTDAAVLSTLVDASLLVVSAGRVDYHIARRAVELLENVNANLAGVILNMIPVHQRGYYYNMYSTYYGEYNNNHKKKKRFFSKYWRKKS